MLFNPKESIDFNGNTGPFIQYTHARISSLLNKAGNLFYSDITENVLISKKEKNILILLGDYNEVLAQAAKTFSPAIIANYVYDLAKEYNSFYQDTSILREENAELRNFRLLLSKKVSERLRKCLNLLGINAPEKM
jgi:arginyl-tRNA synthetase